MEKHILTRHKLLNAQVCSEGTWEEALEWIKVHHPSGTQLNWCKEEGSDYAPVQCVEHPERTHYMFAC